MFDIVGQSLDHIGLIISPDSLHHLVEVDVDAHDEEGEPHAQAEEHVHQDVLVSLTIHTFTVNRFNRLFILGRL